jgi:ABC-type nitrate/sulfonate/bicarbonate transport system permease component
MDISKHLRTIGSIVWIISIFFLWYIVTLAGNIPTWVLPAPLKVFKAMFSFPLLYEYYIITLYEIFVGFFLASVGGIALAVLIIQSKRLERGLYPIIIFSQAIPKSALAPIFILWFGFGVISKIVIVFLVTFFSMLVNMIAGLRSIEPELFDLMLSLGANKWQILFKIRFPSSLPFMFSGLKIATISSVIGALIGEWVGGDAGLGFLIVLAQRQYNTPLLYAAIINVSLISIFMFGGVIIAEKLLLPWYKR